MADQLPFAAVLLSALLHAIWNVAAKKTPYKGAFLWWITLWGCLFLAPVAIYIEWSSIHWQSHMAVFPALSILSHASYTFCLAESYRRVPFSVAYPVSRGMAQIFIVIAGLVLFDERPGYWALGGVFCILVGVQATAAGAFRERMRLLVKSPWPLAVALCICAYTSIDHRSVQILPPLTVCLISNLGQCLLLGRIQLTEFQKIPATERQVFLRQTFCLGAVSTAGYSLFLWAQHIGGLISIIGPLRESSILIGMLLGFLFLKEDFQPRKILASLLIVCGIFIVKLA
ncbi:MAG: DMT family transporter [Proteobacteria bacterium]|nr:DMT family transporter [Pseudomonadota bacterium]